METICLFQVVVLSHWLKIERRIEELSRTVRFWVVPWFPLFPYSFSYSPFCVAPVTPFFDMCSCNMVLRIWYGIHVLNFKISKLLICLQIIHAFWIVLLLAPTKLWHWRYYWASFHPYKSTVLSTTRTLRVWRWQFVRSVGDVDESAHVLITLSTREAENCTKCPHRKIVH